MQSLISKTEQDAEGEQMIGNQMIHPAVTEQSGMPVMTVWAKYLHFLWQNTNWESLNMTRNDCIPMTMMLFFPSALYKLLHRHILKIYTQ